MNKSINVDKIDALQAEAYTKGVKIKEKKHRYFCLFKIPKNMKDKIPT